MGKYKKEKRKNINIIYGIGIMMILAVVPLIVFGKNDILSEVEIKFWKGQPSEFNFFTYYKAKIFIILSYLSGVLFLAGMMTRNIEIKKAKFYIPAAVYGFFILISSIFSDYFPLTLKGFVDQYQGMWVLLGYIIAMIVAYNISFDEKICRYLLICLSFSTFIVTLIGLFQYLGYNFLESQAVQYLILPEKYHQYVGSIVSNAPAKSVTSTLFNGNYVGSYTALLLPFFLMMSIAYKDIKIRTASIIISVLLLINLFGTLSSAGYFGLIAGCLSIMFFFRKKIKKIIYYIFALALTSAVILFAVYNFAGSEVNLVGLKGLNIFSEAGKINSSRKEVSFEEIITGKDNIVIKTNKETLEIKFSGNKVHYLDEQKNQLDVRYEDNKTYIESEKYKNYIITEEFGKRRISVNAHGRDIYFYMTPEGVRILSIGNQLVENEKMESMFLDRYSKFASARGYIWIRTLPLIKKSIIKGYGADTYTYVFPQHDIVGKLNNSNLSRIVVDKPHNVYLQIVISSGLIAVAAVIYIFAAFVNQSVAELREINFKNHKEYLLFGLLTGIISYLFVGIFNDESVTVAPVFWILLGIGYSLAQQIKEERENQDVRKGKK